MKKNPSGQIKLPHKVLDKASSKVDISPLTQIVLYTGLFSLKKTDSQWFGEEGEGLDLRARGCSIRVNHRVLPLVK